MEGLFEKLQETVAFVKGRTSLQPSVGIVLGSGLGKLVEQISDLSGLSRKSPIMAACMAVIMFSMAGIPPMVGFFSKLYVFMLLFMPGYMHSPSLALSPA